METVIIGDITDELAQWAKEQFPTATLLDNTNVDANNNNIVYTSLGDLNKENFIKVITTANRVIFHDTDKWSNEELEKHTKFLLSRCPNKVENFVVVDNELLNLVGLGHKKKQLWVTGASLEHGTGVSAQERYGQLIANKLQRPVTFLTHPGSSIQWAADQLLRSDIKKDDIVLWGLTSINRYQSFKNNKAVHIFPGIADLSKDLGYSLVDQINDRASVLLFSKKEFKDLERGLLDDDRLLVAVKSVHQVINFCKKIGANLILYVHPISTVDFEIFLTRRIYNFDNLIVLSPACDLGTDPDHPGPISHNNWANEICNFIDKGIK
jgi:hypothetical protein